MIDGTTKLLGVLGWPVEHSMSPVMHNAAIQAAGLNACYVPLPCPPEALGDVISGLRGMGFLGANLTIPHKQAVIEHLDGLSEESRFTGSVNTLYWEGDRLMGTSTDAAGAVLNLRQAGIELDGKRVTILGTGGAARALAFVLARGSCAGAGGGGETFTLPELAILGRDRRKAERLTRDVAMGSAAGTAVRAGLLSEFTSLGTGADLIINCTSVGMAPDVSGCPIDPVLLQPHHAVYDIVYQPRETVLLREAKQQGCQTVEGIGMLVHQGAASFRIWFGHDPDTAVMFDALEPFGFG
ncbi:MAG: shikimate dehydrogenase [Deltaproteobacteria bacterium]|nr:shikimate dehydrogenase [Deltaproteobacteria bacterium]